LDYIQRYIAERRRAPLIREIQTGCQINSYKSTVDRLNALERKGYIRRKPNQHRGIRIVRKAVVEPQRPVGAPSFERTSSEVPAA